MKRIILICLLTVCATSAIAEWRYVTETPSIKVYLDFKTIRKEGDLRKAWVVLDSKEREIGSPMSRQVRFEYDCKQEKVNVLSFLSHSESMAQGNILNNRSYPSGSDWQDISPESTNSEILKIVCAK